MIKYLKSLFKKDKSEEIETVEESLLEFSYISPKDISSEYELYASIPEISIPTNDKTNILIMDDNYGTISYIIDDLDIFENISELMSNDSESEFQSKSIKTFIEELTDTEKEFLSKFKKDKYNIIPVTGDMAAFAVENAIKEGLRVDIAILDIILGGFKIEKGYNTIYDGIDIANIIWNSNPKSYIKFYTGCVLSKYSSESLKFTKLFNSQDINEYAIIKDHNINNRRKSILGTLINYEQHN